MKKHIKKLMKSNLVLPPYLVPYKDAMYQDHFDLNHIRFEKWWLKSRPVVDKPMPVTPVRSPSATEYVDMDKIKKEKRDKQVSYKVDNGWFGEW
ncbi:hypothetical protein SAMN05428988_6551 [Chitinophaga sp. YR573]|uniref:hypothetical protein n=1 Tax=Chitinophaga sp. YR573 TaxID=1881040 RepID=UPI0008BB6E96|nr:hypothetical protein [Chitinophaga sp. YR573]SEW46840.1 hypothetical protein SAMN05428988_6551 [Chitinophaga sp. YR573]